VEYPWARLKNRKLRKQLRLFRMAEKKGPAELPALDGAGDFLLRDQ
jgi:hypothetical protein